jgi:hypothetical protein
MSEEIGAHLEGVFARMGKLAAAGPLVDAAGTFIEKSNVIYTDEEVVGGAPWDFWKTAAPDTSAPTPNQKPLPARSYGSLPVYSSPPD